MQSVAKVLRETMPGMFSEYPEGPRGQRRDKGGNGERGTHRPEDVSHG